MYNFVHMTKFGSVSEPLVDGMHESLVVLDGMHNGVGNGAGIPTGYIGLHAAHQSGAGIAGSEALYRGYGYGAGPGSGRGSEQGKWVDPISPFYPR